VVYDVVIVGAGASGIGCGVVLRDLGIDRFLILDRHHTGASFDHWPEEMRFITPSFTSNPFSLLDLNAVCLNTSPAFTLQVEHPTGRQFASYLRGVQQHFNLPVKRNVEVHRVEPQEPGFRLHTSKGRIRTRFVIWATGEFQFPDLKPFPGAELCIHTSKVARWSDVQGDEALIVGGYESGADAAAHLCAQGKRVTLLDGGAPWESRESDPSIALSPYTRERLAANTVHLVRDAHICRVARINDGYEATALSGKIWRCPQKPFLATGFRGGLSQIEELFAWRRDGTVVLTESDESTRTPGLFVAGPQLRHKKVIFCFIYKSRQRFAVVGRSIAERLDVSLAPLERYRAEGMLLDDLTCCKKECAC